MGSGLSVFMPQTRDAMRFDRYSLIWLVAMLMPALLGNPQVALGEELPGEHAVRAAMVFNFLKFSELPHEVLVGSPTIEICLAVGGARQAEALTALSGCKVGGREVKVAPLNGDARGCHVLYVDTRQRWNTLRMRQGARRVLSISAYPGFARDGGMLEIAVQADGVRFDVNLAEGRNAGIRFSPQMLRLARRVYD
jgi:hypothetical protein